MTARSPFVTTRQAADLLVYSRPDSFLRAWRRRGLPLRQTPGGRWLVARVDLEAFTGELPAPEPTPPPG